MKKNIKKIATMLVAMLMAVSMVVSAWADSPADDYEPVTVPRAPKKVVSATITVKVNGKTLSERGVVKNGRTFLPVATLGQSLGLATTWDQATKTVIVGEPGRTVEIKLGSKQVLVNGEVVVLDVPAFVLKGRTMLPVSFIAKYLGLGVSYDAKAKVVAINSSGQSQSTPQPAPQPQDPSRPEPQPAPQPVPPSNREFVLEPLPELYPAIEYNDRAPGLELYPSLSIDIPYEEMARYGVFTDKIKPIKHPSPESGEVITLREFLKVYVVLAELEANSDPRNIPINISENSVDWVLWKKVAKTGVFQFLINSNGKANMDRALTWPEICHIWINHYRWMGVDPYKYDRFSSINLELNGYNGPYVSDINTMTHLGYYIVFTEGGMNNRKLIDNIATKKVDRLKLYFLLETMSGGKLIKR